MSCRTQGCLRTRAAPKRRPAPARSGFGAPVALRLLDPWSFIRKFFRKAPDLPGATRSQTILPRSQHLCRVHVGTAP